MGLTNFPNEITSFGVPIMGSNRFSNPWSTHYFVNGDTGISGGGTTPASAFKTIQEAVTAMTGGDVVYIKPNYTSQQCSKCSHTEKSNRNGNIFKCKKCNFELDADLNASRNIARIGRTDFLQGLVNSPIVGIVENKAVEILN